MIDFKIIEDDVVKDALVYFHQGYSCAQSVFASFSDYTGLDRELSLRLAAPFGAGIGRMRGTCGAFLGVVMLSGYLEGNTSPEGDAKEHIYSLVQELAQRFKREHGTLLCHELLGLESDKQESTRPQERNASYYEERPCERCIATAAALGARLLHGCGSF